MTAYALAGDVRDALTGFTDTLAAFSVLDWILVGAAVALIAWGWVRALSFTRLGTIGIKDLSVDEGTNLQPAAVKAALQQQLAKRGWLPASGVPSGSPTVKAFGEAVSAAPVSQAQWIGALISLVPTPPAKTSFEVSGTLYTDDGRLGLAYQLDCTGPTPSTVLGETKAPGWPDIVDRASKDIFVSITEAAPAMYPGWARWRDHGALQLYRAGLEAERERVDRARDGLEAATRHYKAIYRTFRAASRLDPDNLLARLRVANSLERLAGLRAGTERADTELEALESYVAVWLREPTIFEAGFRASVLLSTLADQQPSPERLGALWTVLERLELARTEAEQDVPLKRDPAGPSAACHRAAKEEGRRARRLLRIYWTVVHEGRFRHRFEPSGRERRQLRKALGISRMCQHARRARALPGGPADPGRVSDLTQWAWRAWVRGRYFSGRMYVAGWQAHYNAACFYALLPQASESGMPFSGRRVRRRALEHLRFAVRQSNGELDCSYVRDEDPDLKVLRDHASGAFERMIAPICPDELTVHYRRPAADGTWRLHVTGEALMGTPRSAGRLELEPTLRDEHESVYRVRIFDENKALSLFGRSNGRRDERPWRVVPVEVPDREVWVVPGTAEVHLKAPAAGPA